MSQHHDCDPVAIVGVVFADSLARYTTVTVPAVDAVIVPKALEDAIGSNAKPT
jgi:hypothetical protein